MTVNISTETTALAFPHVVVAAEDGGVFEKHYPASEAQLEIWLSSQQSVEANCSYNEISTLVMRGALDVDRLIEALQCVVKRNSSLRTIFSSDGQTACVLPAVELKPRKIDFSHQSASDSKRLQRELVAAEGHLPFDLENGPLLRCAIQKVTEHEHRVTFTAHHIIMDGWSMAVFGRDLGWFYDSLGGEEQIDLPVAGDYQQYANKMKDYFQTDAGVADEKFWVDQFADSIPVLDLPIAKKRPALRTYNGARYDHFFDKGLVERARKIGARSGCSLYNVMLSAFSAYVARLSGNDDFCIGIPTAGQAALDETQLIGHCVNALPWRTKVDSAQPFVEYMKTSRSTLLNALDHQCYSYGTLLRKLSPPRDPARAPMLNISFNVDPVIDTSTMGFQGLDVAVEVEPRAFENFEWFVNGVIHADRSIEMQVQYNTDLFTEEAMAFYFEGFEAFLGAIVEQPESPIIEMPMMSLDQRQRVIVAFNETKMEYPLETTLHAAFSKQASETPDKIAVVFEDTAINYADVETRSNQIARYLHQQGIGPGDLVGICVPRSADMLVMLYGIMKSGAGYVPLDPAYPSDRLKYMCDHSGLKLVVTECDLETRVADFGKPVLAINQPSIDTAIQDCDHSAFESKATPGDICYVIYTSGSTGKPKGVQVPHGAVVNFLVSMKHQPGFSNDDSVLAVTTLSFDIAVLELYLPTIHGGKVIIVDSLTAADGKALCEQLETHDIALMQATPATWRLMIGAGWEGKPNLKVLCGGEPMPRELVAPLLERCGELWNMYGPTETTVWSAVYRIVDAQAPILIGKPVGNTQIYILDAAGNEVPIGCEGEVFIGGAGVTLGYRNRAVLTEERFVANRYRNPFVDYVSDRLYRTGDLAKFRFDGNIEFLRRNDKQVKVRGFRIELGEIESTLLSHAEIDQAVVIVREDTVGDARLVAYCVFKHGCEGDVSVLKDLVRAALPYYMVPQNFVTLDAMPQTNNGKIDHNALPSPKTEPAKKTAVNLPFTAAEKFIASIWSEVLEIDSVELNDNFFDVGGHSLLVMRVIAAVKAETGIELGPQDFLVGTLEQLADQCADHFEKLEPAGEVDSEAVAAKEVGSELANPELANPEEASPELARPSVATDSLPASVKGESTLDDQASDKVDTPNKAGGVLRSLKGFWDGKAQE